MLHNMLSNHGYHGLACNAGEANRYIVAGQASRPFLCTCISVISDCFHDSCRQPSTTFRNIRSREHPGCRIVPSIHMGVDYPDQVLWFILFSFSVMSSRLI